MKLKLNDEPRVFSPVEDVFIKDYGKILLEDEDQISIESDSGKCHDLTRKEWGWYLCNSVNASLKGQGYKTALVMSLMAGEPRIFVNLVDEDKVELFFEYLQQNKSKLICWLDEWGQEP